jgi:alpha-D-xyloside xylohydrolase
MCLSFCLFFPARIVAAELDSGADLKTGNVSVVQIANGIWRLRFGQPEEFTPTHFASGSIQTNSLNELPAVQEPPLKISDMRFDVSPRGCVVTLPMSRKEHVYGMGLNTRVFDKTGKRQKLIPSDKPEDDGGPSHAPVPFYVSTAGYGVFVDTARYAMFYAGTTSPKDAAVPTGSSGTNIATSIDELYKVRESDNRQMLVDIPAAQGVDIYLFAGPQMLDAVRRYNLFSGGGAVPPLYGLGMVYRGKSNFTAQDSETLAQSFREAGIPCDIWGLEPGWQTATYPCTFVWDTNRFPNPAEFVKTMSNMGYHLSFWEHCFTRDTSPIYNDLIPWSGSYLVFGGLVPDFATPQARKIFVDQQEKSLFSLGVLGGMKLDECDNPSWLTKPWSFPEVSRFPSGLDGEQMHSLLGVLYQQTMLKPFISRNLRTWGLVRNSQALAASLPYTIYSDSYDHVCYVRGLANEGFSGLLWVPEVRDAVSTEDLYRRVESVIFSPQAVIDPWYMRLPPWLQSNHAKSNAGEIMPEHAEVTAVIKRLFELRMSLIPYLYSAFNKYHLNGTPPIRALVMDWPHDSGTYAVDNEFMFGPSLLVAPMFAGVSTRAVYLPAGKWYDYWTGEMFNGGSRINVSKPFDQIPLFVKDNSLIPIAAPVQHISRTTVFDITVKVYGSNPKPFVLFEDDGESNDYLAGKQSRVTLAWSGSAGSVERSGGYTGLARFQVGKWQQISSTGSIPGAAQP